MNLIQTTLTAALPPKRKQTPSGWISFNAPCCHHRGEKTDTRKRGGVLMSPDGFQYHCFNCGFKAGWLPGKLFSKNTKDLFRWLGVPDTDVNKLSLEALKNKEELAVVPKMKNFVIEPRELPPDSYSFETLLEQNCTDEDFLEAVAYILDRKMELEWYDWHWSPEAGYKDRVLIPFYLENQVVGYTGRKIRPGTPKYLTHVSPGYVFNLDAQSDDRKYVIVVEGQFDAISVDGVAIGHNDPNEAQIARINGLGKEVIVVPDQDKPGANMIKTALEQGWTVSLPEWGDDVKDCADAVKKYGRIYTLFTILQYREANEIKIKLLKKKLENKHE
jgi:hypothetical protein